MMRFLRWPYLVLYAIALLLFAAWYVPRLSADRYRDPIRSALQTALGRKVRISAVKFRLLPVPGFTVSNVIVGEDPAIGAEPVAYITELRARPRLSALFGGPLAFASVDLEDTSVNLTRADRGADSGGVAWNFTSLMRPGLLADFPVIHMNGGRVNFKFGDTKSIFYLLNTDVDVWPPAAPDGPWTLALRAEPARTDRPARGFGWFTARGQWRPGDKAVTLDVKLEKSELGDIVTLFEGRESGLHGHIWGDAHLAGPAARVGIAGRLMVDDVHGWNQTPPGGSALPFAIGGAIDIHDQLIDLRATTAGRQAPVDIRYHVADYLGRPRWAVTALFSKLPLSPLLGLARNLGVGIPEDLSLEGTAQGAVDYSIPEGIARLDGEIGIADATIGVPGTPPLRVPEASLRFSGSTVTLAPAAVMNSLNEKATLTATWDAAPGQITASLATDGMSIASLRRQISVAGVPLLSQAAAGVWSGQLRYSGVQPAWSGEVQLKDTDIPFEGFADPLHIVSADASIDGSGLSLKRLNMNLAGATVQGEYRYDPAATRPHRFRLAIPHANAEAIEKALLPSLHRGNFLNYALNLGHVPEPDWLSNMHADGALQFGSLDLDGTTLTKIKTRLLWDADEVRLTGLQGQIKDAAFSGDVTVRLDQREPRYEIAGKIAGMPWREGIMNADGALNTFGTGADLLHNLTAQGSFRGRDVDLGPPEPYDSLDGCFEWAWDARNPHLKLSQLVIASGGETWLGSGEMQASGRLLIRLSDGNRQMQASGAILRGDALRLVAQ